jgi:hypothetical protein
MMNNIHTLYCILLLFLFSCGKNLISEAEEKALTELTEADNIKIYEKGHDTYLEIYNSQITDSSEQNLFSSIISKAVYDLSNKNKGIIDNNGYTIISFINGNDILSYKYRNNYLSKIGIIYDNITQVFDGLINNKTIPNSMISDIYSIEQKDSINDAIVSSMKFNTEVEFETYGFEKLNYKGFQTYSIYIKVEDNGQIIYYALLYDENTGKLLELKEIE